MLGTVSCRSSSHAQTMCVCRSVSSIWEEEGCDMVSMSCKEHDGFTANSQFITHLMGRILGAQGLKATPVRSYTFKSMYFLSLFLKDVALVISSAVLD